MPKVAYFDFCKTLTSHQSLGAFVRFAQEQRGLFYSLYYKLHYRYSRRIGAKDSNARLVKQLKGLTASQLAQLSARFCSEVLDQSYEGKTLKLISELEGEGYKIVIVSAGLKNYIEKVSFANKFHHILASELELKDGRVTGHLKDGVDMYGPEKVKAILRFEKAAFGSEPVERYCISDHISDLPMLNLGRKVAVITTDEQLLTTAQQMKWKIL